MAVDLTQYLTRPVKTGDVEVAEQPTTQPLSEADNVKDPFAKYGVSQTNGNTVGFATLNKLMDDDGIGFNDTQRHAVQQQWLKNFDAYAEGVTDPEEKEQLAAVRERITGKDNFLQEDTVWEHAKASAGRGKDMLDVRYGVNGGAITDTIIGGLTGDTPYSRVAENNPGLMANFDSALRKKRKFEDTLQFGGSYIADKNHPLHSQYFNEDGTRKTFESTLTPEELEAYQTVPTLSDNMQRERVMTAEDGVLGHFGSVARDNMRELAKQTNIVGYDAFQKTFEESPWETAFAGESGHGVMGGLGRVMAQGLESTISQAPELVAGALAGAATGGTAGFLTYQTISSASNISIEAISGMMDYVKEKYTAETGKSIADISDKELIEALKRYSQDGSLDKAYKEGMISGVATAGGEALAGLVTGSIGAKLMKFGLTPDKVKTAMGHMAVSAGVGVEAISECIEESSGQIAQNLQKNESWNKGVSQGCVQGLLSIENAGSVAGSVGGAVSDVREAQRSVDETTTQENQSVEQADDKLSQVNQDVAQEDVSTVEEAVETPIAKQSEQALTTTDLTAQLRQEFIPLYEKYQQDPTSLTDAELNRMGELEEQYADLTEVITEDGVVIKGDLANDVRNNTGLDNENRTDNGVSTEDVNGSTIGQGIDGINRSRTQRSSEVSEPFSPDETQTVAEGDSQSDTQLVEDITGEQNDNSQTSYAIGSDGSTREANGQTVEQGTLGVEGIEQVGESTEATQFGSTDSGVQQRTESDSSRETLIDHTTVDESSLPDNAPLPPTSENLQYPKNMTVGEKRAIEERMEQARSYPTSFKSKDDLMGFIRDLYKTDQEGAMQLVDHLMSENSQLKLRGIKASVKTKNSIHNDFYKDIRDGRAKTQQDLDREQSSKKQQIEDLIKRGNPVGFMGENLGLFTTTEQKALAEGLKGKIHSEQLSKLGLDLSPSEQLLNDYYLGSNAKDRINTLKKGLTEQAWGKLPVEDRNKIIDRLNKGASADRSLAARPVEFMVQNRLDGEVELNTGLYAKAMEKHNKKANTTKQATGLGSELGTSRAEQRGGKDKLKQVVERNNDKLRRMNEAMAEPKLEYADDFKGSDLRANQKVAHRLIKDHPQDVDAIREAFMRATPIARPASFDAAKRGYVIYSKNNPKHAAFKGDKADLRGFDFDGNPIYRTEEALLSDMQESGVVVDQTTVVLATQPETAKQVYDSAVKQFFKYPDNKRVEEDMRFAIEKFAEENNIVEHDGATLKATNDNLVTIANNQDFLSWVDSKLRPFFNKLNKLVAGVIAFVTVGAMTIPTDAMAQQGFSTFTGGQTIQGVSQEASNTINWVSQHNDHGGKNYVVADKDQGKIHVVSPSGEVLHTQNALFGKGKGNDTSAMNTPSGRMQLKKETRLNKTERGIYGDSVLDLTNPVTGAKVKQSDGGIVAMHRVVNKPERKAALKSASASDNYLSYGCINIPTAFYNKAVDSLDGAMVYVLDHKQAKQAKQATVTTKPVTTKSGLTYTKSSLGKTGKSKLSINEVDYSQTSLKKADVEKALKQSLGGLADRVTLISKADFDQHQDSYAYINRNGVEGFFDPESGSVFLVADNLRASNGLTGAERAAWVGWHELTHAGLDVKHGTELNNVLNQVKDDTFISQLAEAIQLRRASRNDSPAHVSELGAVEEAIAEINAAVRTNKLQALSERYGVVVPSEYHSFAKEMTGSFLSKLRNLFNKVVGRNALTSNNQVINLLKSLPQDVESYAPVASKATTEKVLSQLHDPESAYNQAKYSIGDSVNELAKRASSYVLGQTIYRNKRVLDQTGADPNKTATGRRQDEVIQHGLTPAERLHESLYDSQAMAIKYVGGLKSKFGQMIKTTTNRTARTKQRFHKDVYRLLKDMQDVAKKAYKKEDRVAIQNDLQNITTALASVTGVNKKMMDNYERLLFGEDYGLETQLAALNVDLSTGEANQVTTPWQAKQIGKLWTTYQDMKAIYEKSKSSANRLMGKEHAREGEDPERMRENLRMYNGQTTAEAYNRITKAVAAGLIEVKVRGKAWSDHIKDVGFTEDKGFADESSDYSIAETDIEVTGHLSGLIEEYAEISREVYNFKKDHLGPALSGEGFGNRFEVPTMGKVESMKLDVDSDGNFITKNNKTVKDKVDLAEATEYQSKRLGRAFLGGNAIQNLNMLVDLTAQQVEYNPLFKALYDQRNDENAIGVKVFNTTDPEYSMMKGAMLYVDVVDDAGKPTGKKKYIKVALDNDEATAALFGDNVQMLDNTVMSWVQAINRIVSVSLTFDPTFGLYNAYRGLQEKFTQLGAEFGTDSDYFMDPIRKSESLTAKMITDPKLKLFTKPYLWTQALGKFVANAHNYLPAAFAMSGNIIDKKGKWKHGDKLLTQGQRDAYKRLTDAYDQGTISTRAESFRMTPEELQTMYSSYRGFAGGVLGTLTKTLPQKIALNLNSIQEYLQFVTSAMELTSTLITQDVLTSAGMDMKQANEANLFFMNFNDRGASKTSSYLRAALPFANATAQGNRSTVRSFNKKGWGVMTWGVTSSIALLSLAKMVQDMYPCEDDVSEPFENKNPAELQRDLTFRIGCGGEFRLPVEYGAGQVYHAGGVAAYQVMQGNWDIDTAFDYFQSSFEENMVPFPMIPDTKSNTAIVALKSALPAPFRTLLNLYADTDDFGNPLSSRAAKDKQNKYAFAKPTTPEVWTDLAQTAHGLGFNPTPEQMRYAAQGFLGAWVAKVINTSSKDLKEGESRAAELVWSGFGGDCVYRPERDKGQKSFIEATNAMARHSKIEAVVNFARELGDEETGKLKFGSKNSNLYTWLGKQRETGKFTETEMGVMQIIAEFKKRQAQISGKRLSKERKDELHHENNAEFLELIRPYNKGVK